jgi:hypothetical protein
MATRHAIKGQRKPNLFFASFKDGFEGKGKELPSISSIKFGLKLDPMKTKCMEESRQSFHQ